MAYNQYNNYPYGIPNYNPYSNYQAPQQNTYAIVNGIEGAKQYPLSSNQTMLLMDSNEPIAYKKTVNGLGQATIEAYKLVPIVQEEPKQPQEYALKCDLEALKEKIDKIYSSLEKAQEIEKKE